MATIHGSILYYSVVIAHSTAGKDCKTNWPVQLLKTRHILKQLGLSLCYQCLTGDACQSLSRSFSFINGVLYCCNDGDNMSLLGPGINVGNVIMGKRNVIINNLNQGNLNCSCSVVDPATLVKINQVNQITGDLVNAITDEVSNVLHNIFGDD
ncbi:unnamed protein product [Lymnaea stagnalis]|uniref:Uncharacterized protein n=1 Tax=Lymnaea stagnalis TaxID=6523 RepID=A0AAV2HKE7_LYMST